MTTTKIQYELFLFKDCDEYIVDLREDTVNEDGDNIYEEYIEGFIFHRYDDALDKYQELEEKYNAKEGVVLMWNEMEEGKR
tara:strand:- start:868 stop:1110 length:243 start_codon:yes stop_codon:yes gene_type:complete